MEFVLEADSLGIRKAEGRVLYFEAGLCRVQLHLLIEGNGPAIDKAGFNNYRRRVSVNGHLLGIDYGNTVLCGKPQLAIARPDAGRPMSAVAFDVSHALCFAVSDRSDAGGFGSGKVACQLLLLHPIDALVGTHPEVAA